MDSALSAVAEGGKAVVDAVKRRATTTAAKVKEAAVALAASVTAKAPAVKKATKKVTHKAAAGVKAKVGGIKKSTGSSSSSATYVSMISDAIAALHERGGSSRTAIRRYIEENHADAAASPAFDRALRMALSQPSSPRTPTAHTPPHPFPPLTHSLPSVLRRVQARVWRAAS